MTTYSGGPKTGHKNKLYRNSGTHDTPTWEEICEVGDVSVSDFSIALAELKRRCSNYTKNLPGLFNSITIEFRMQHGLDADMFDLIRDDFLNQTAAEYAVADGDINGEAQALVLPALVSQFPWDQPLEDVAGHDVQLAVAYMSEEDGTEIDPYWLSATSSA